MFPSPPPNSNGSGRRQSFVPTATEFTPKAIEARDQVLRLSFITQTIPNIHRYAGIVGLCTVPEDKADMNNLGWHIADFLAFRALLCGDNPPKAQTWLSMCDISALVEAAPQAYTHGKDKRLVGSAVRLEHHGGGSGIAEREDDIQVETSAEALKEKFISAAKEKLKIAEKYKYPLLLIICGLTSLEQDIFFGKLDTDHQYTMKDLRHELGDSISNVEAMVVTPSLFSAGWQINASFGRLDSPIGGDNRAEFLARQFGGIFAQDLVKFFLGWNCPAIDDAKVDARIRRERFPGPVVPSDEVNALISQLKIKIQSYLVGGLSNFHMDHSFSFNKSRDEWEKLIERRERSHDHRALECYEQKWKKLPSAQSLNPTNEGFSFLGNAFGGTRDSQLNHIKCLIEESYLAWPDYWALNFGQETKKDLERFMNTERPGDLECHEIFNVLEHRARTSILADTIVQYFDLPMPHNQRCRDWDHFKWQQELPEKDRVALIRHFGNVLHVVPSPNVPPGINPNYLSRLQMRLESGARYVRAALGIRFLTTKHSSPVAIDRINTFLHEVKVKQAEMIASNPEVYQMCHSWLTSIKVPIREPVNLGSVVRATYKAIEPVDTIAIPDRDDEYDIYQDDDVCLGEAAGPTEPALAQQQEYPAAECSGYAVEVGNGASAAITAIPVAQPQPDESVKFPQKVVDLAAREIGIIKALHTTSDRQQRNKLTTELLELLEMSQNISLEDEKKNDVAQNGAASMSTDNDTIAVDCSVKNKNGDSHTGGNMQAEMGKTAVPNGGPEMPLHQPSQQPEHMIQQLAGRKTPPHMRGFGSGRRN